MNNDHDQLETFTPEQIDEQIEGYTHYPRVQQPASADEQLISDLSVIYGEYTQQRDRLWQRISVGMEQQPHTEERVSSVAQDKPALAIIHLPASRRTRRPRWQLVFSALAAGLIVASMLWLVGSRLTTSTKIATPRPTSVPVDPACNSNDEGWVVICQHHYEQAIQQSQTITTSTLGTLEFTVDSAYIDDNRAIIKYHYIWPAASALYQATDYPQLSTAQGMKFPGVSGDQPVSTDNETIMTFETGNLTQRSGELSLHFIDEFSFWKNVTLTPKQKAETLLQEKHTVSFNFSIKIQPEYKVINVGQTQAIKSWSFGTNGKLTWERIIVTPSATRLIMSGINIEGKIEGKVDMAGYVMPDGLHAMNTFGVYFGKQHVTDKRLVKDQMLQQKPPIFELFYFQPLFNQAGQWSLHWPHYELDGIGTKAAKLVDHGYTYNVNIK